MKEIEIVIHNPTGLHARPAKVLVNLAKQFKSDISVQNGEKRANAKSIVSVLTLGVVKGTCIRIQANGEDEDKAITEIENAIRAGLGDEEPAAKPESPQHEAPAPAAPPVPVAFTSPQVAGDSNVIQGVGAAPGIAVGPVFHYQQVEFDAGNPEMLSRPVQLELNEAVVRARSQLDELRQRMIGKRLNAEAAIFEAHMELLDDPELMDAVQARIQDGEPAAGAWNAVVEERATEIGRLHDPLLAARADDLRDVGKRVLRLMFGYADKATSLPPTPVVVIARELAPSETASFDPVRVLGFGIVEGGPTSHIAILARALGIPAVVGAPESILELKGNTLVILNGSDGSLHPDPAPEAVEQAKLSQQRWLENRRLAQEQSSLPAVSKDGRRVEVTANAGSVADAEQAVKKGADGIGLLRTEFLFLERSTAPNEEEQFGVYRAIAEAMQNRPVIVRTLDIGGDKPLPYIQLKPELNPFLGERGIRLCLNRPELFREQLRAILRAASFGTLRIMFPMVSDIAELRQARALIDELRQELGAPPVQIGIMVEVPSAALLAEVFAPEIDFFSIGTNDLTQYTLAMDRGNSVLAAKHDGMHPSVLRLIAHTIEAAHKYGKRADICGELGSDTAAIPVLLGLGMDELSVSIPSVPSVKAQVRSLDISSVESLAREALNCSTAHEVRALVKARLEGAAG